MKVKIGSISIAGLSRISAFIKGGSSKDIIKAYTSAEKYFSANEIIELEISYELPKLQISKDQSDLTKDDEINTINLHQELADLSPAEAASKGIWAWFTHIYYWDYMKERWPVPDSSERSTLENIIFTHYLISGQNTRSFIRNGIARLWWYGYLSVDEGDYTNTGILLRHLDIASTLLERTQGRNKLIRNLFFKRLLLHKDKFLQKGDIARLRVRALAKKINLFGSIRLIDSFPLDDLESAVDRLIEEVLAEIP